MSGTGDDAVGLVDDLARLWPVLAALMAGLALAELDATVLATALPTVVGELGGSDRLLWPSTAYLVAGTVMMPVLGRLGDLLGRRPVFLGALAVLVAGSVLGALAVDLPTLVLARAVQGLGGGGLVVLVYAVLADLVPARRRATVMTAVGAVFAGCAVAGPLLGGWLTEGVGWRWAFWLNLPVGLAALAVAARTLPRGRPRAGSVHPDAAGTALLAAAVVVLTLAVTATAGRDVPLVALGAAGSLTVVLTLALVVVERRARQPLLPPVLFADRTFVVAVLAGLALGAAVFGTVGYLPTYLQMTAGLSPTGAGLMMLPLVGGLGAATVGAAQVVARTGRHRALPVVGSLLAAVAFVMMSTWGPGTSLVAVGCSLALLGTGIGCAWEVLVVVVQSAVPERHVGVATATNGFFREVGVLVGSAAVGGAFASGLHGRLGAVEQASGLPAGSLTPAVVAGLPPDVRSEVAAAYADSLTPVFLLLVGPVLVGAGLLLLVRRLHLSGSTAGAVGEPAGGEPAVAVPAQVPASAPRFSVVVPAHNEVAALGRTLASLGSQDFAGPVEVVVVDNASSDGTGDLARAAGVRVEEEHVLGVCAARQRGTDAAVGEIVVSTDADTVHPPDWLTRIDAAFRDDPRVVAVAGPCRYEDPPAWAAVLARAGFGVVAAAHALTGRVGYVTATNLAFRRTGFPGYDTSLTQGGDEVDLLRRLQRTGPVAWDHRNEVLTSSRRLDQGLAHTLVVSFGYYYAGGHLVNRLARRRVVGVAPPVRPADASHVQRVRRRWQVVGLAAVAVLATGPLLRVRRGG